MPGQVGIPDQNKSVGILQQYHRRLFSIVNIRILLSLQTRETIFDLNDSWPIASRIDKHNGILEIPPKDPLAPRFLRPPRIGSWPAHPTSGVPSRTIKLVEPFNRPVNVLKG